MEDETSANTEKSVRRAKILLQAEGYLELGLAERALQSLSRLEGPSRRDASASYLRGEALRELERHEEALRPLARAAELTPDRIRVWLALAWCYKRTDRLQLAIDAMQRALDVAPSNALLHYNLACYWSLAGQRDEALRSLSRSLEMDPDFRTLIDDETDFDPLRRDPDFQALCAEAQPKGHWKRYC
jgi:tetratricopeptide (TPR) repeat protein